MKIHKWEIESGFYPEKIVIRNKPAWVTLEGDIPSPSIHVLQAEDVLEGNNDFDIKTLPLRDPNYFVSGQIHDNLRDWQQLLEGNDQNGDVLKWLEHGVNVYDFFRHFKGKFKGRSYDSEIPPKQYFPNS